MTERDDQGARNSGEVGLPVGMAPILEAHAIGNAVDLSVVITARTPWSATSTCLDSIFSSIGESGLSGEVILADDSEDEATLRAWHTYSGRIWPIHYSRNSSHESFAKFLAATAKLAHGRFLCVLSSTVSVSPMWADKLVATLKMSPTIGLVAPKLLDPEGRTREAGLLVYSDGDVSPLGAASDPQDPRFGYVNDLLACSLSCAVMRTEQFRKVLSCAGSDFAPGLEDIEVCFRLSELGYRVVLDPAVCATIGTETNSNGIPTKQVVGASRSNRLAEVSRWKARLADHCPPHIQAPDHLRSWVRGETVMFIWPTRVDPRWSAGALRNWMLMAETRAKGFHVVCVAPRFAATNEDAIALRAIGIEYHESDADVLKTLNELTAAHRIKAVVLSFIPSATMFSRYFAKRVPNAIRIFDTVDLVFLRELRGQAKSLSLGNDTEADFALSELPKSVFTELGLICLNDLALVVSDAEAELVTRQFGLPAERLCVVSTIHEPDLQFRSFRDRDGFSFIGYGKHEPNVDAIRFIVGELWANLRQRLPSAKLYIYGSELPDEVTSLHNPGEGIYVMGYVEDHREALRKTRILLAPLRFGAGVKGKIGESLAVGTVVVTTPVGAEGMDATGRVLAVGESTDALVNLAYTMHEREDLWARRSECGRELLLNLFSGKRAVESMIAGIDRAVRLRREQPFWRTLNELQLNAQIDSASPTGGWALSNQSTKILTRLNQTPWINSMVASVADRARRVQNPPLRVTLKFFYRLLSGRAFNGSTTNLAKWWHTS